MERKKNEICIIIYLLLQIIITKPYKLNTSTIYTKIINNDDIKQFFKMFDNYDTKKGSLIIVLKV